MRRAKLVLLLFILSILNSYSQVKESVYKNLSTKSAYSFFITSRQDSISHNPIYELDNQVIDKLKYKKYRKKSRKSSKTIRSCQPCILKNYDIHEQLIREYVAYGGCGVGWFKDYYPNGNIQLTGQYKENPTGDWNKLYVRGYCSVPDGKWTYFNENADTLYSEYWNNGEFIKQVPEQNKAEIWGIDILLHGIKLEGQKLSAKEFKEIEVIPKFKNNLRENVNITLGLFIGIVNPSNHSGSILDSRG